MYSCRYCIHCKACFQMYYREKIADDRNLFGDIPEVWGMRYPIFVYHGTERKCECYEPIGDDKPHNDKELKEKELFDKWYPSNKSRNTMVNNNSADMKDNVCKSCGCYLPQNFIECPSCGEKIKGESA